MMFLTICFELVLMILAKADNYLQFYNSFTIVLGTPLIILFNLILAKTYDYFFREIDG